MMKTIDCDEEERAGKTSKTQVSAMNNGDRSARTRPYDPLATQLVKKPPSEFRAYPLLVCGECDWIIGSESGRPLSPRPAGLPWGKLGAEKRLLLHSLCTRPPVPQSARRNGNRRRRADQPLQFRQRVQSPQTVPAGAHRPCGSTMISV